MNKNRKYILWNVQDILLIVAITEDRRKKKRFGQNCRMLFHNEKFGAYITFSVPLNASAQKKYQCNFCSPKYFHYTELRTTLHHDGGMSMYRKTVPNIKLCNQNECILFHWLTNIFINHQLCSVTKQWLFKLLWKSSARIRPNQYFTSM